MALYFTYPGAESTRTIWQFGYGNSYNRKNIGEK